MEQGSGKNAVFWASVALIAIGVLVSAAWIMKLYSAWGSVPAPGIDLFIRALLVYALFILLPVYAFVAGFFADKPNKTFCKKRFLVLLTVGTVLWAVGFYFFMHYSATRPFFRKGMEVLLLIFFPLWAVRKGLITGTLPFRFGDISSDKHPTKFLLGILFYLVIVLVALIWMLRGSI